MVTTVVTTVNALKVQAKSPFGYHGYHFYHPRTRRRRERGLTVYRRWVHFRATMVTKSRNLLNLHDVVGYHVFRDGHHRLDLDWLVRINTLNSC